MSKTLIPAVLALLSGAFSLSSSSSTPEAPPAGPGAVAIAVQAFLAGLDAGEPEASLLVLERHDVEFVFEGAELDVVGKDDMTVAPFCDVGHDGAPFAAATPEAFAAALGRRVASDAAARRVVRTESVRLRANCASEHASLAIVEFTRCVKIGDREEVRVPMRATALLRYEREAGADGQHFRIYHWHASRAAR